MIDTGSSHTWECAEWRLPSQTFIASTDLRPTFYPKLSPFILISYLKNLFISKNIQEFKNSSWKAAFCTFSSVSQTTSLFPCPWTSYTKGTYTFKAFYARSRANSFCCLPLADTQLCAPAESLFQMFPCLRAFRRAEGSTNAPANQTN